MVTNVRRQSKRDRPGSRSIVAGVRGVGARAGIEIAEGTEEARTSIITGTDATITVVQDPEIDREVQEALTTTTTIEKVIIGVESARCLEIAMMQGTMTKIRDGFDMTKEEVGMDAFLRHVPCLVLSHIRGRRQDTGKGRGATMVILGVREVEANFEEADHLDSMICYLSESTQTVVMT